MPTLNRVPWTAESGQIPTSALIETARLLATRLADEGFSSLTLEDREGIPRLVFTTEAELVPKGRPLSLGQGVRSLQTPSYLLEVVGRSS